MRLQGKHISRESILASTSAYEIIESYPEDKYLPSYLVYSRLGDLVFHVLFAADVQGNNVRVVTTYRPNAEKWMNDLKTRRPRP